MFRRVRRIALLLIVILCLAPGTWLRTRKAEPQDGPPDLRMTALPLPPASALRPHLGVFELEGVWQLTSRHWRFSGYSALVALGGGELLAISDRASYLRFPAPGAPRTEVTIGAATPGPWRKGRIYDSESAAYDAASGTLWIGWEYTNTIGRTDLGLAYQREVAPRAMRGWGRNSGPEAMARLADGRFIVLREGFDDWLTRRDHRALVFAGDPVAAKPPAEVTFSGPAGFSPTEMAQLPDGRLLVLMRRVIWPLPQRFAGRIAVLDPREIRQGRPWRARIAARLSSTLPIDNFEGMAIEPRADGKVTVWLISDDNSAAFQRTLLWKLALDPAKLR